MLVFLFVFLSESCGWLGRVVGWVVCLGSVWLVLCQAAFPSEKKWAHRVYYRTFCDVCVCLHALSVLSVATSHLLNSYSLDGMECFPNIPPPTLAWGDGVSGLQPCYTFY